MKASGFPAKKIAVLALFTALGLIVFIIENQFPPLIVPGAKMGLANIFSLSALILYGPMEGFIVVAVRTILGSLFAGNISMIMYSFTGGMVSLAVSAALMYLVYPRISVMAVSIAAAVVHNIVQTTVFVLISNTPEIYFHLPFLALIGILSGAIVGAVVSIIFKKIPESVFARAAFGPIGKKQAAPAQAASAAVKTGEERSNAQGDGENGRENSDSPSSDGAAE